MIFTARSWCAGFVCSSSASASGPSNHTTDFSSRSAPDAALVHRKAVRRAADVVRMADLGSSLFYVLDLLPHLLDDHLHFDGGAGRLQVLRLGRQRIGFPIQLLHQEVQPPAGRLVARRHPPDLLDMATQPV